MNLNMKNNIDTILLHIGVNDVFEDRTSDNVISYIKNAEIMVQKCRAFGVKRVFLPGIVYTRIALNILEDIHSRLVSLSMNLDICYSDNLNIRGLHLR